MKKPQITKISPVDENHQVVTVTGGEGKYCVRPCSDCPWRKDATGIFPPEAFRLTANTAYDMAPEVFGCHQSGTGKPATCAGFLLNGSNHNLSVRISLAREKIDLRKVSDGGHQLYENYRAMAVGNGVDPNDPILEKCRDD